MKNLLILVFLFLVSSSCFAQGKLIIGTVSDADTKVALRDVEVYWQGNKDDLKRTNKFGVFQIEKIPETKILVFEYPGKKLVSKNIDEADHGELNVLLENMGATSVTASRWEQSVYDVPASTVIVTREEIEQHGYLSLQEILENVPGLFVLDQRSENGISVGVRGFWSDFNRNVMIQVNGVNMVSERQNDFNFNKVNIAIEAIDKIEIVRGPMSVIYGSGAFFGVINIITNEGIKENSYVSAGIGSQNKKGAFFRYSSNKKGLNLSFNAMMQSRNGFEEKWADMINTENQYYQNNPLIASDTLSAYERLNINDTIDVGTDRYSKKYQSFNFSANYDGFFANLNYALTDEGYSWVKPGPANRNTYKAWTGNYQVGYRGATKDERFDYEVKVAYMKSEVDAQFRLVRDSLDEFAENRVSSIRTELNTRYGLMRPAEEDKLNIDLLVGVYFSRNLENNSYYNLPDLNIRNWYIGVKPGSHVDTKAAYLQTELKKGNLRVVAGGRLEKEEDIDLVSYKNLGYYVSLEDTINNIAYGTEDKVDSLKKSSGMKFIPRLALIYQLEQKNGSSHYFKGMYGEAQREVSAARNANDIMVYNHENDTTTIEGYKDLTFLPPEKVTTVEVGYTYVNDSLGLELNANFFYNELDSLLTRDAKFVTATSTYAANSISNGALKTYGVELIAKYIHKFEPLGKSPIRLITTGSITIQNTKKANKEETDTVSFSPPYLGKLGLTLNRGDVSIGLGANYVGEMFSSYQATRGEVGDTTYVAGHFIGNRTAGYWRFSVNISIRNQRFFGEDEDEKGGFYANFKVANLFNKKYLYPAASTFSPYATSGILGRQRQIYFSLGYAF